MSMLTAKLTKRLPKEVFIKSWKDGSEVGQPPVKFDFGGRVVKLTTLATPWDLSSLRKAFQMAVHRADRHCQVVWID